MHLHSAQGWSVLLVGLLLAGAMEGWAQTPPVAAAVAPPATGDPTLTHRAGLNPAPAHPGETLLLRLQTTIPPGYKLYSMTPVEGGPLPTRIALPSVAGLASPGVWHAPQPEVAHDPNFKKEVGSYHGAVEFTRLVRVEPGATAGPRTLTLTFSGQICNPQQCLLQRQVIDLPLEIMPGAPRPEFRDAPPLPGMAQPEPSRPAAPFTTLPDPLSQGLLSFLLMAFLAGLLALLTPCVFPMIPLTVSFFSKAADARFGRVLKLAGTYALSIILTFTAAGMLISILFGAAGLQRFAAHPLFNLAVAAILVAFGLSLLGLFELRLPSGFIERSEELKLRFGGGSQGPSLPSVFFMALTFTLVSFSCTVAFLGVVLVAAAQGHWLRPALGLLAFSSAFALPFFLLALFPRVATRLQQQGGEWLPLVKVLLGLLELAAAIKFVSNVDLVWQLGLLPRNLALAGWIGLAMAAVLYLLHLVRLQEEDGAAEPAPGPRPLSVGRLLLAMTAIALTVYLMSGLFRNAPFGNWIDGWLPPTATPGGAAAGAEAEPGQGGRIRWQTALEPAIRQARQEQKLLFLNFTGVTCTNCRYMEEGVLSRPEIAEQIARFVPVELYTDRLTAEDEAHRTLQIELFSTAALPLYAVITPERQVRGYFPGSTNDPAEFLRFLQQIDDRPPPSGPGSGPPPPAPAPPPGSASGSAATQLDGTTGGSATPPGALEAAAPGGPPLEATLPRLFGGQPFRLTELRGRWVLLHHWASWCGPCRAELQGFFLRLAAARRDRGLTLVTVAFDGGDAAGEASSRAFAREVGLDQWPALLADAIPTQAGLPEALVPSTFPTTYLLAPDGRQVWRKSGELKEEELVRVLERHLPPTATPPP